MKKFIAALMSLLFLFCSPSLSPVTAEDTMPKRQLFLEEVIKLANQELGEEYYAISKEVKINGSRCV